MKKIKIVNKLLISISLLINTICLILTLLSDRNAAIIRFGRVWCINHLEQVNVYESMGMADQQRQTANL